MTEEHEIRNAERFEIQKTSQLLVKEQIEKTTADLTEKIITEKELGIKYQKDLESLKQDYENFLRATQNRENELLSKLKTKDEEITGQVEELENLKYFTDELTKENSNLLIQIETNCLENEETEEVLEDPGSENLSFLQNQYETLQKSWREIGNPQIEENTGKIEELKETLKALFSDLDRVKEAEKETELYNSELQEKINSFQNISEIILREQEKLSALEEDLESLKASSDSRDQAKALTEKLRVYRADKETLQFKLEKVYEMLVKENLVSSENQELLTNQSEILKECLQQLEDQKSENESLSENVIQEKMNISKGKDILSKSKDIDSILQQTLKQIDMEGAVKKTEEGFFYRDISLNLYLHSECMIVVKIGAGLMPLADYLRNTYLPGQLVSSRNILAESRQENLNKREIRSPLKPVPVGKASKTPLRDRANSISDKKKTLK